MLQESTCFFLNVKSIFFQEKEKKYYFIGKKYLTNFIHFLSLVQRHEIHDFIIYVSKFMEESLVTDWLDITQADETNYCHWSELYKLRRHIRGLEGSKVSAMVHK